MAERSVDHGVLPSSTLLLAIAAASALIAAAVPVLVASDVVDAVRRLNIFLMAAVAAVAVDLWRARRVGVADCIDGTLFVAALVLISLGPVSAIWLALSVCGAAGLRRRDTALGGAGVLMLGIAIYMLKDRIWGGFVSGAVLELEAMVLQSVFAMAIGAIERIGNVLNLPDGRHLVILRDCSLLSLLAPSMLGVAALRRLSAPEAPRLTGALVAVAFVTVLANFLRLVGMAVSPDWYAWLHDGPGSAVFSGTLTLVVGLTGLWRLR